MNTAPALAVSSACGFRYRSRSGARRQRRHHSVMARADLLVHLVRAARERDDNELGRTVESLIAEERGKQHHLLAERLEGALRASTR